jgi:hypothetical protein
MVRTGKLFTVILYEFDPMHPPTFPLTLMVDVIGAPVELVAVKELTSPFPLAPIPMAVLLLVQLNVAPAGLLLKVVEGTLSPLQTAMLLGTLIVGPGLTVIVYELVPVQPDRVAVTLIVDVIGELVVLIALNDGMLPFPLAPIPMAVLLFVQLYDPPAGEVEKLVADTAAPLHIVMSDGTVTTGFEPEETVCVLVTDVLQIALLTVTV